MKLRLFFLMAFVFLPVFVFAQPVQYEESITITTYYPSPYGSYNELRLYPHSDPVTTCNINTKGTMYYDSEDNQIYFCNGNAWIRSGYWAASGNNIYNINPDNVGIGTTAPTQKLDVTGYVKGRSGLCIGDDCRSNWMPNTITVRAEACGSAHDIVANCPHGSVLIGGGYELYGWSGAFEDGKYQNSPDSSFPRDNSWVVHAGGSAAGSCFRAYAICAR